MTAHVVTATSDTTLADALALTRDHGIRHIPICDGARLVGLVSDRDLRLAMPPIWADRQNELRAMLQQKTVGEVMVTDIITVTPETLVEDAAKLLYTHRIGCVPVLDADQLVGILTETDLLRAFVELFGARADTTRLEVRMPNKPGELARVVRLIGIENRTNITGMVVPPLTGTESVAVMHIQTREPDALVEALRKLGYAVGMPSLELDPEPVRAPAGQRARNRVGAEL